MKKDNYNMELRELIDSKGFKHNFIERKLGMSKGYLAHLLHDRELSEKTRDYWIKKINSIQV